MKTPARSEADGVARRQDGTILLSYAREDGSWAAWIARVLEGGGYQVAMQDWAYRPGSSFVLEMERAVAGAEKTVCIISPAYLASDFGAAEWAAAFSRDPSGRLGRVIPVRVGECDVAAALGRVAYVDLVGIDESKAREMLLRAVRRGCAGVTTRWPGRRATRERSTPHPANRPSLWNAPPRNPMFVGREAELSQLEHRLTTASRGAVCAIHGPAGIGKTELAKEYAYRHAGEYDLVWWLRGDAPTSTAEDAAVLLCRMLSSAKLCGTTAAAEPIPTPELLDTALRTLSSWLLILDEAPGKSALEQLPHAGKGGAIIVTSRSADWAGAGATIALGSFQRTESIAFIRRRLPSGGSTKAGDLASALGDSPLLLTLACSTIAGTGISEEEFLKRCRRYAGALGPKLGALPSWRTAIAEAEKEASGARRLLFLLTFLGADAIPRSALAGADEPARTDKAIDALQRSALIAATPSAISVHSAIQDEVFKSIPRKQRKQVAQAAVLMLERAFTFDGEDPATWQLAAQLAMHILAAARHAEDVGYAAEPLGRLLSSAAECLITQGRFREAREAVERALRFAEREYGPDHPSVAACTNNLGSTLRILGDLGAAREATEHAIRIAERTLGPESSAVGVYASNLCSVLRALGDLPGALRAAERGLAINEKNYGPNHPAVAESLGNLGAVLADAGDLRAAEEALSRALKVHEALYGPDHPEVARDANNLSTVLAARSDLVGARAAAMRAVAIAENTFGRSHPYTATCISNYGAVQRKLGDLPGALASVQRALAIDTEAYGPGHQEVGKDLVNLSAVLAGMGNPAAARTALERALATLECALGSDHPETQAALARLAALGEQTAVPAQHAG